VKAIGWIYLTAAAMCAAGAAWAYHLPVLR